MPKVIKMLVSMAGPDESYQPGDVLTVSDNVADAWAEAGIAVIQEEVKRGKKVTADDH